MERNNIKAAISLNNFDGCESRWQKSIYNDGTKTFYEFITTPSYERDKFIASMEVEFEISGAVLITKI